MTEHVDYRQYLQEDPSLTDTKVAKQRQHRALGLFLALVVVGGIALFAYFASGRGWSLAATIVDDTVGDMSSYSAVIFNGVGEPDEDDEEEHALLEHEFFEEKSAEADTGWSSEVDSANQVGSSDLSRGLLPLDENGEISYKNLGEQIMSVFYRAMAKIRMEDREGVFASDVRDLYETAGADVCTINIADPDYYEEPRIFVLGEKHIGVFSVSGYISRSKVASIVGELRREGADAVICIAPRTSTVSTYEGLDVLITTDQPQNAEDQGKGDVLLIDAPCKGEVGIVLFSVNNVPIFKSVSEL